MLGNNVKRERDAKIDIMRGLGIICIVLMHISGNPVNRYFPYVSWAVQFFIIVSGMTYNHSLSNTAWGGKTYMEMRKIIVYSMVCG